MPPLPPGRRVAAPENPLRRISLCHSVETYDQDAAAAAAWKEGNKMQQPPGRRRTRDTRATKSTAAEELAPVLGEVAEKS